MLSMMLDKIYIEMKNKYNTMNEKSSVITKIFMRMQNKLVTR